MVRASAVSTSAESIIPAKSTLDKRLEVVSLLTQPFPPSDAEISRITGVHRNSVRNYRVQLTEAGVEWVRTDNRSTNSGRRTRYQAAYVQIEAYKLAHPESGGRDIWTHLARRLGLPVDEIPSVSRIDAYLSEKKMVMPKRTGAQGNLGQFWLYDRCETFLDVVQMDECYPFRYNGQRLKVCDLRDGFSGAVFAEPFPMDFYASDHRGMCPLAAAGLLVKFVSHIGFPRFLRLDNGGGQIIASGWLPELVRHAIQMGITVEWEPYGTPTGNSFVERWHEELQKQWRTRAEQEPIKTSDAAYARIRQIAFEETFWFPRRRLNRKAPADVFPMRAWEFGDSRPSFPVLEPVGKGGCTRVGTVRMHRRVEAGGLTQLHGSEYVKLSESLTGGKVRIDFLIEPGGGGEGSVLDSKGEVVMTFRHRIEQGHKLTERLTYDHKEYVFSGGEDARKIVWSQEAYDAQMEKAHKSKRSKGFTASMAAELGGE